MSYALDALTRAMKKEAFRAAILKDDAAFEATTRALKNALSRSADKATREAVTDTLERLRDMDAGAFTKEDAAILMAGIERRLGAEAMRAAMRDTALDLSDILFRMGFKEVGDSAGVDIAFGRPDRDALDVLTQGNLYWVGESWNGWTQKRFDTILTDYFKDGMTREQLVACVADDFQTVTSRSHVYWEMLADHVATKTRELGRTTGYERADIQTVQVRAHLDASTTAFCRAMNGRVIAVSRLSDQKNDYLNAIRRGNMDAAKTAWPMHGEPGDLATLTSDKLPDGVGAPPYHFRCRTITVMYTVPSDDVSQWEDKAWNREQLTKGELSDLVERLKTSHWVDDKTLKGHYDKHGRASWGTMTAYNQSAVDLIRRGNRDIYIAVRGGRIKAYFVEPYKSRGKRKFRMCVVDVRSREIHTLHKRPRVSNLNDDVPAILQTAGRGITKWFR